MITVKRSQALFGQQIAVYDGLGLIGTVTTLASGRYSASSIAKLNHRAFSTVAEAVRWITGTVADYELKQEDLAA